MSKLIPYLGGKRLLTKNILSLIPQHQNYCEPFAGSATILFEKDPSPNEVLNDINRELTNLFRVVQYHLEEFLRLVRWNLRSRAEFERLKHSPPGILTDIQRAARFYYLLRASYSGRGTYFSGRVYGSSRPFSIYRIEETLYEVHRRLENVTIECLTYKDCILRYDAPETFFYLDPPYWGHENDYGKGIFSREDFDYLGATLKSIKGKYLLSINDVPEIRNIFAGQHIKEVSTTYSVGTKHGKGKQAKELLIGNYKLK